MLIMLSSNSECFPQVEGICFIVMQQKQMHSNSNFIPSYTVYNTMQKCVPLHSSGGSCGQLQTASRELALSVLLKTHLA